MVKKVILLGLGLIVIIFGFLFVLKFFPRTHTQIKSVFVPTRLPNGFFSSGPPQINTHFGDTIIQGYQHPEKGTITFSQIVNPNYKCLPPQQNSNLFSDYKVFKLDNNDEVCALTLGTVENNDRVFTWRSGDIKFMLKGKAKKITDSELLLIANSLAEKEVEVEIVSTEPQY